VKTTAPVTASPNITMGTVTVTENGGSLA
jgi:hypothetical protein